LKDRAELSAGHGLSGSAEVFAELRKMKNLSR